MSDVENRYVKETDPFILSWGKDKGLWDLSTQLWWSRKWEYRWAVRKAKKGEYVLDAGCGVGHPFKFMLAYEGVTVDAIDKDQRLESTESLLAALDRINPKIAEFAAAGSRNWGMRIACGDFRNLPIEDDTYDRVFCISTLEHMGKQQRKEALEEFARVVKPSGRIHITFDAPQYKVGEFATGIQEVGLEFEGEVDMTIPKDAIGSEGLRVFRSTLRLR